MRMPNKKTRHKFKMGLMVVQVLLGIITPSVSSVSNVMADSTTNSSSDVSAQTTEEQDSSDKAANWVADAGEVLSEQNSGNTLVGAATDVDDAFVFTTSKSNGDGTIAIVETTIRRDKTMHVKVMIQKNDVITSTQDYDTTLVVSDNIVGLKDNSTGKVINITDGSQSSVIAAGGGLDLIFAGASSVEGGLAIAAIAGGPVTLLAEAAIYVGLAGVIAISEYKIYQNNEILQTERSSTKLNTAVQQNNSADTQKYTKATQQNAAKIHGVLPNSNSVKSYSSYSGSMIDFDFKSIDTMSSNMRSIQTSLAQTSANLNQSIANMNASNEKLKEMNSSLQASMESLAQNMQIFEKNMDSLSKNLESVHEHLNAASKACVEASKIIEDMIATQKENDRQNAIRFENERKNRELNGVALLLPNSNDQFDAQATDITTKINNENNVIEVSGSYKYYGGKVQVSVDELPYSRFSHINSNYSDNQGHKDYYFDVKDDQTFTTKIKLDNFVVNGSQLYRIVYGTKIIDSDNPEYNLSRPFKALWYNGATGKVLEHNPVGDSLFHTDDGFVHDPIHVIPKIDPIVPDKGAVIQGQTDPNREVEININGKWTDSVQSDDKGIFRFPPKDLNFNDSVYIEVIPKEVSGKYLEGRTIYLTMDRSSAQYKDQFLKHAQDFSVEELAKYLPTGWTIKVIVKDNGEKLVHIKDPALAEYAKDIINNSDDKELARQLEKIGQDKGYRIRIDQADGVTTYQHIHKYNDEGLLMNEEGEAVDYKSPDGHIPYNHEIPDPSVIEDIIEASKSEATKGKWLTEGTAKKFLSTNGTFFVGLHKLDGKYYYFDPENGGLLTGNITTDKGKKLLADPDTGIIDFDTAMKFDDKYYLVNPSDLSNKTGFQKTTINGVSGYYYFDDKTGAMTSEDKIVNGDKYYFEKGTGRVKTGWVETDTGKKYLDENKDGLSFLKGIHYINGDDYIFDNNGNLLIGKIQFVGKDRSYHKVNEYNSKNNFASGYFTSDKYLFASNDGKLVEAQEFSLENKYYYADYNGELQSGFRHLYALGLNKVAYYDPITFARVTDAKLFFELYSFTL